MPVSASPTPLRPGRVGPRRAVPAAIERPEYVGRPAPAPYAGPEVKDEETIEKMRLAGRLAAQALQVGGAAVAPGVSTCLLYTSRCV